MAQTKRKRKHKHRGTQAGTVEARGRTGRRPSSTEKKPQNRADARQLARDRRAQRLETPPTWKAALNKAAISALIFGVFAVLALGLPVGSAVFLTIVMVGVYLPLSYVTDRFFYNRRQRQKAAGRTR